MKVLNLYAGIGGNRKLWNDVDVTAVEIKPEIAKVYETFFPEDKIVVGDAHQYLLNHFEEYDFIWSSPPCPSHSRIRKLLARKDDDGNRIQNKPIYPEMALYQEVLLLDNYYKGNWCVENVIAFYEPLIKPQEVASHWFWANFHIASYLSKGREHEGSIDELQKRKGFCFDGINTTGLDKKLLLRNCVEPELGKHILVSAFKGKQARLDELEKGERK